MTEYKKPTDEVHTITLDSKIVHAMWGSKLAVAGEKIEFEVFTHFVGNGSDIQIVIQDKRGKKLEKLKGKVFGDYFGGSIQVPEKAMEWIVFTAKLPKHGLEKKSNIANVIPPFKIVNMKWSQKEARRGDILTLSADVENIADGVEVFICIYEYDQNGAHDFITRFPCRIKNKKIEAEWEFEYHEDTDEIPTDEEKKKYGGKYNPPEYFWVAEFAGKRFRGKGEFSLLLFKDWIEIELLDEYGKPVGGAQYTLYLADGSELKGKLNDKGFAKVEDIVPGTVTVFFPDAQSKVFVTLDE